MLIGSGNTERLIIEKDIRWSRSITGDGPGKALRLVQPSLKGLRGFDVSSVSSSFCPLAKSRCFSQQQSKSGSGAESVGDSTP
jgi:hypothetical protein